MSNKRSIEKTGNNGEVNGNVEKRRKCPYLDTINKHLLDFDFERICSITMSNQNVYACLVCGKYFQGRGKDTHAFTHSVQASHHVFINLHNDRIYCLPDNYEVVDNSLKYIKDALRPTFSSDEIALLDQNRTLSQDVFGVSYLPGFIGLNNLKHTDYVSVILQFLAHIPPLRDYFLLPSNYEAKCKSTLVHRFGEIVRKMWSSYNIKNTISPHEILQEISVSSKKRFQIGTQNESIELLSWILNELHRGLGGTKKSGSSIIHKVFQGTVHVFTRTETPHISSQENEEEEEKKGSEGSAHTPSFIDEENDLPFLFLSLDLPPTPLFKDSQGGNVIPQISLAEVLEKFNGEKITHVLRGALRQQKRYSLKSLPPYLVLHIARFTKNNFFVEKNPTIVNFPIKNLDLKDIFAGSDNMTDVLPSIEELKEYSIASLRKFMQKHKISTKDCLEKNDMISKIQTDLFRKKNDSTIYDLISNICHDSPANIGKEAMSNVNPLTAGNYRVHVQNQATQQWYEIQDLHVQETMPQLIGFSESYMMIYRRRGA